MRIFIGNRIGINFDENFHWEADREANRINFDKNFHWESKGTNFDKNFRWESNRNQF